MPCVHLMQLYQLCEQHNLKLSGVDLIHLVCQECGVKDVCPSVLLEEYETCVERASSPPPASSERAS